MVSPNAMKTTISASPASEAWKRSIRACRGIEASPRKSPATKTAEARAARQRRHRVQHGRQRRPNTGYRLSLGSRTCRAAARAACGRQTESGPIAISTTKSWI